MYSLPQFNQMSPVTGIRAFVYKLEVIEVNGHIPRQLQLLIRIPMAVTKDVSLTCGKKYLSIALRLPVSSVYSSILEIIKSPHQCHQVATKHNGGLLVLDLLFHHL